MTVPKKERNFRSRYQHKRARTILLKTNYRYRRKLLTPNYKTYGHTKLRLVVRQTNTKVICQLVQSFLKGDKTLLMANSTELKQFGLNVGLANYSAGYLTGLLLAKKITLKGLDSQVMFMDIGLNRSTKGARVYSSLKGMLDGGLEIPHSEKIFPGYNKDEDSFDDSKLVAKIHGEDVVSYMKLLKENDEEKYKKHFSKYLQNNVDETNLKSIIEKTIEKINDIEKIDEKEKKDYSPLKKFKVNKMSKEEKDKIIERKMEEIGIKK